MIKNPPPAAAAPGRLARLCLVPVAPCAAQLCVLLYLLGASRGARRQLGDASARFWSVFIQQWQGSVPGHWVGAVPTGLEWADAQPVPPLCFPCSGTDGFASFRSKPDNKDVAKSFTEPKGRRVG